MDEGTLQQAFRVLQGRFGKRLAGDMLKGEVAMRHALMDQLQVDESAADKLVKQLNQSGWILFRSGAATTGGDADDETAGDGDNDSALPDGWRDSRVADTDAPNPALMAAPLVAASSTMGIQQSGNQGPGGVGGAVLAGAAAAELTGRRDQSSERPDPEGDENQISSEAADHAQAAQSEDGYWQLSGSPIVGTT
jgi:hypothetical protein